MLSIVGAIFLALTAYAVFARRAWLPWILSASVPFSATSAFTVAGQSILAYPVVALVIIVLVCRRYGLQGLLGGDVSAKPGVRPLVAFGLWSIAVTLISPHIFAGLKVLDPREGIDDGVKAPASLAPQISNFAQIGYLSIGIGTVICLASYQSISPRLPALGFGLGTALSSAKGTLPDSVQKLVFDNSSNVSYTSGEFNGVERMRGIFSEPSALGAFSVAGAVFFLLTASRMSGRAKAVSTLFAAWSLTNALLSFSAGAIIGGLAIVAVLAVRALYRYASSSLQLSTTALTGAFLTLPAGVLAGPIGFDFVELLLSDKAGSDSYQNRNAADAFSLNLSGETYGLGAGLGSNRPSSFFASMMSTTGVVGLVLLSLALATILLKCRRISEADPVVWALISVVVSKVVSGPDVSEPLLWFLLAVCAATAWRTVDRGRSDESVQERLVTGRSGHESGARASDARRLGTGGSAE